MLHASFVRAYTHALRLHMMCTLFLVYTYVIHTNIALHCVFTIAWLYIFQLNFQASFRCIPTIYTAYVYYMYNSLNFTGILHIGTRLPGTRLYGWWIYICQVLHKLMEITIYSQVY